MYVAGNTGDDINEYNLSTAWNVSTATFVQAFSISSQDTSPQAVFFKPDGTKMYVIGGVGVDINEYNLSTAWNVSTASYVQAFSVSSEEAVPLGLFFKPDGYAMYIVGNTNDTVYQYSTATPATITYDTAIEWPSGTAPTSPAIGETDVITFNTRDGGSTYQGVLAIDGAIDLATGNYFDDTLAANTTYTISNAGAVQAFQLEVTGGAVGYDIGSAVYDSVSFSVASQETAPIGVVFKTDGTKMYVVGQTGDDVNEYDLSTAWDVSTASFVTNFSVASQDTTLSGLFFRADGVKLYVIGRGSDGVYEYDLSSAWDISTSTYLQTFSVASQETNPSGVFFKTDGTKMYVTGTTNDAVNEYDLSTAWDISTASYNQNFSVLSQDTLSNDVFFKPDGTAMYMAGAVSDNIFEYSLSTAWDVSTASYIQSLSVLSAGESPQGLFFKPDGTKVYVLGAVGTSVYQYTTSVDTTLTWPSSIEWAGGVAPSAPAVGETDVYTLVTDDGGTSYVGVKTADNLS
jgi:DNA-binding beta-propeller fold protein YncE